MAEAAEVERKDAKRYLDRREDVSFQQGKFRGPRRAKTKERMQVREGMDERRGESKAIVPFTRPGRVLPPSSRPSGEVQGECCVLVLPR